MKGGGSFGKVLILSFRDDEEYIINRILSCMNRETEILHQGDVRNGQLHFEGLYIDEQKRIAVRENNEIELTYTEFEILLLLAWNMGKVFSKEQIYDRVWKEPYFGDYNIVMSHIRNLREKIEDNPSKPIYIQTVWGVGYRFNKNLSSGLSVTLFMIHCGCTVIRNEHRCDTSKEIKHLDMSFDPVVGFLIHICFYKSILTVS